MSVHLCFSFRKMIKCLSCLILSLQLHAQPLATEKYNLTEIIAMAQGESPQVKIENARLSNAYWRYQSYKADLKPRITFDAILPFFNRSIDEIVLPTGASRYVNRSQMNNDIEVNLSQPISRTGGTIFAATGLSRLDIFQTSTVDRFTSYRGRPFYFGFQQPLFAYNNWKWDNKIRPLEYDASNKSFFENKEQIAGQAVSLYFDLLIAQLELEAISKLKNSSDTLFLLNKSRFDVGKIAETELLQSEVNLMNTDVSLAQAKLSVSTANERLRNFLGVQRTISFILSTPDQIPDLTILPDIAVSYAQKNRSDFIKQIIDKLMAESNLDRAKKNSQINLSGQIGFTQTNEELVKAVTNLLDQEVINFGINVPIADWGKTKSRKEIAKSNLEIVNMTIEQERTNIEQEIKLKVNQLQLKKDGVRIAQRAMDASNKRMDISTQRYLIGKISIIELNQAIEDQNRSRQAYFTALRDFWTGYYEIRRLTLWDFVNNRSLAEK